jgi:hypothetical protein
MRDGSRFGFDPRKRFSGVLLQQGRVRRDSDSNGLYVLLRRFLLFAEQSVNAGVRWAGFEPNSRRPWWKSRRGRLR